MTANDRVKFPSYAQPPKGDILKPGFNDSQRNKLMRELKEILKKEPAEKISQYAKIAAGIVAIHKSIDDVKDDAPSLVMLEKGCQQIVTAISGLSSEMLHEVLPLAQFRVEKMTSSTVGSFPPDVERTKAWADWAAITGRAARELLSVPNNAAARASPITKNNHYLVEQLAVNYREVFGKNPSYARNGKFDRALRAICIVAKLPAPSETTIRKILPRWTAHRYHRQI